METRPGVLDVGIWVGYAWADQKRNRATVVVTGDDEQTCLAGAEELGRMFWNAREEFTFVAPTGTFDECLDEAVRAGDGDRPFFISDSGDNPTAGGSGDVTWGLEKLLQRPEFKQDASDTDRPTQPKPNVVYASVPGPEAVDRAIQSGLGSTLTVTVGADVDKIHSGPITFTGKIHSIKQGDPAAGTEVAFQIENTSIYVIIPKYRKPYHKEKDFMDLDLDLNEMDIVIDKIGYLEPDLFRLKKRWMLALTPGGVNQYLESLNFEKIRRPMWPFDKVFKTEPELKAELIPMSNQPLTSSDA